MSSQQSRPITWPGPAPYPVTPSLPINPQLQSRLLQLPTEILEMILKSLLVSQQSICSRDMYLEQRTLDPSATKPRDAKGRFVKKLEPQMVHGYRLTPTVLRVCQSLLLEGWPMLYDQNILTLKVKHCPETNLCGNRGCTHCPDLMLEVFENKFTYPLRSRWTYKAYLMSQVSKFTTLEIDFDLKGKFANSDPHFQSVQNLIHAGSTFLTKRHIVVRLPNNKDALKPDHIQTLRVFGILRCPSFKFIGSQGPVLTQIEKDVTSQAANSIRTAYSVFDNLEQIHTTLEGSASMQVFRLDAASLSRTLGNIKRKLNVFDFVEFDRLRTNFVKLFNEEISKIQSCMIEDDTKMEALVKQEQLSAN